MMPSSSLSSINTQQPSSTKKRKAEEIARAKAYYKQLEERHEQPQQKKQQQQQQPQQPPPQQQQQQQQPQSPQLPQLPTPIQPPFIPSQINLTRDESLCAQNPTFDNHDDPIAFVQYDKEDNVEMESDDGEVIMDNPMVNYPRATETKHRDCHQPTTTTMLPSSTTMAAPPATWPIVTMTTTSTTVDIALHPRDYNDDVVHTPSFSEPNVVTASSQKHQRNDDVDGPMRNHPAEKHSTKLDSPPIKGEENEYETTRKKKIVDGMALRIPIATWCFLCFFIIMMTISFVFRNFFFDCYI